MKTTAGIVPVIGLLALAGARAEESPIRQDWDYAKAMRVVAAKSDGRPGVVLHVGDSITYSNPYGQWARAGRGKTAEDKEVLQWMHTGADDETDGWWLARFDHPDGGRSHTAAGGLRVNELLAGGKQNLPPLSDILDHYRPRIVVLLIGSNDVAANRPVADYKGDVNAALTLMIDRGIVPILSTIPPYPGKSEVSKSFNLALRDLARARHLPLIDFEAEILRRRPDDWNGTLLNRDDPHPTATAGAINTISAPTAENLRSCGYLLRGWLTVKKVAEVKKAVFDAAPAQTARKPAARKRPKGQPVKLAVTRDTWFSNVGPEADANLGGAPRLKLKSIQEMSLIDIDPAPLRGRVIQGATLHVRSTGAPILRRVTVGTFGAEWSEGTSPSYAPQVGSSDHNHRRHPDLPWSFAGSDLCSVILGQGGTTWRSADASPPDRDGWQEIPVGPSVVAARVAGVSFGLFLFDDTGSEWTRQGEQFRYTLFPNRYIHSRESGTRNAPYLTVYLGPEDRTPPGPPTSIRAIPGDLPAGEAIISWESPEDQGAAGTIGFIIKVDGRDVPRYLIPAAGKPGERVMMHLRDLNLKGEVALAVRAVDGSGNLGPTAEARIRVSDRMPKPLPGENPVPARGKAPLPKLGNIEVAVIDELDKVQPINGTLIPEQPDGYLNANHLWDASTKHIQLHAARNEYVAFQVLLRGPAADLRPTLMFPDDKIVTEIGRYHPIPTSKGPLPDPIVPLDGPAESIPGQKSLSLHVELYVPHDTRAGDHDGTLTLTSDGKRLDLPVELHVWDFNLPDHLNFIAEMNCYDLPANERDYYRLAHAHRTVLNRVPYYHRGQVAEGLAPVWDGKKLDWTAWDRRFGPYFDGKAFVGLPRRGVPIDCFYLPLFENWPSPMEGNYNGDYWADHAFPERYWRTFEEVARRMAEHFNEKKWDNTYFQFYLNGKVDFKRNGWSHGTSPWLLDEPANFQDYWALRTFGAAFHRGINHAPGRAKLVFRADISRPEWQRDTLDGLIDYNVVGGAFRRYNRMVLDRKAANGGLVIEYGSANALEDSNMQGVGWALDAWALGSDGVLPWQTVGNADSWSRANPLALFYPGRRAAEGPLPSVRLKAFRRGQQDVEYLSLLAATEGEPRWAVGRRVREALGLVGERRGTGLAATEDAGVIQFARFRPQDAWALRIRVGRALAEAHPKPNQRLVDRSIPRRDPARLRPAEVSADAEAGPGSFHE